MIFAVGLTALFWIGLPVLNFYLAKKKNRSPWQWAVFGIPLPITSSVLLALWPARTPGKRELISPGVFLFVFSFITGTWMYIEKAKLIEKSHLEDIQMKTKGTIPKKGQSE